MARAVTLRSRLPEVAAEIRPKVGAAIKEGAIMVAEDAAAKVHYGPPPDHIADSIEVRRHEAAGYLVVVDVKDPKGYPYPFAVELGSAHAPAYPFLIPALEENAENVTAMVAGALRGLALHI